jgi:uncharacterized membrane protein
MNVKNYNHALEKTSDQIIAANKAEQTAQKKRRRAAMVAIEQREERKLLESDYLLQSGD